MTGSDTSRRCTLSGDPLHPKLPNAPLYSAPTKPYLTSCSALTYNHLPRLHVALVDLQLIL